MRRARALVVAITAVIAGVSCFTKPDAPILAGDGNGGSGSGSGSGSCMGPADDMSGTGSLMACGTWGSADLGGTGTLARSSGGLVATVGTPPGHADCVTLQNFDFSHGASIDVQSVLMAGSGDTTRFTVTFPKAASLTIQAQATPGGVQVSASCTGPGGFSNPTLLTTAYRFWKIAIDNGTLVGAYHSATGTNWTAFGTCSLTTEDLTVASARFGVTAGSAGTTRMAVFDDFQTCTTAP